MNALVMYNNLYRNPVIKRVSELTFPKDLFRDEPAPMGNLICEIVDLAERRNLGGNIWHHFLLSHILADLNPFSLKSEMNSIEESNSLFQLMLEELTVLLKLANALSLPEFEKYETLAHYQPMNEQAFISPFSEVYQELFSLFFSDDVPLEEKVMALSVYYNQYGAGQSNQYMAFRWIPERGFVGIDSPDPIQFDDLVGYDEQKSRLIDNTKAFLNGFRANNVLLFGDRGTGKSSSVKALLNKFYLQGLRIMEVGRHQFDEIPRMLEKLRFRGLKYVLFLDDLSFEEHETGYKHLKALIQGGLEVRPQNVLIYATSNRRNIIKETWKERSSDDDDVHPADTREEKLSLVDRFGLAIGYISPEQKAYLEIVHKLAERYCLKVDSDLLEQEAIKWALLHKGRSGRTAEQFIHAMRAQMMV